MIEAMQLPIKLDDPRLEAVAQNRVPARLGLAVRDSAMGLGLTVLGEVQIRALLETMVEFFLEMEHGQVVGVR
jgi:hypothetical protein